MEGGARKGREGEEEKERGNTPSYLLDSDNYVFQFMSCPPQKSTRTHHQHVEKKNIKKNW